jgi:uncharacterized protein YecE (DUF72 family)
MFPRNKSALAGQLTGASGSASMRSWDESESPSPIPVWPARTAFPEPLMDFAPLPQGLSGYVRLGTCSWKYPSWKGLLYDPEKSYRPQDFLEDYARSLDTVEVDQWFWSLFPGQVRLPDPRTVRQYAESVPADFVFTVKAPNALTLTHFYSRQPAAYGSFAGSPNPNFLDHALLADFLERLAPFGPKLGPVMFQFEYLNKVKMPSKEAFFERFRKFISKAPTGYRYAVETRNPNYISEEFFDLLEDCGCGFVYLEGYYMPSIGSIHEQFQPDTADFAIIRLHGGDRAEIESKTGEVWNRLVSPRPEAIEAAVRIIRANAKNRTMTYVNINNHLEGSAPLTIERLLRALSA